MTGIISVSGVELMGYDHRYNLWGDSKHYSSTQNYSLRGRIFGSSPSETVSGVWNSMSGLIAYSQTGMCNIIVNGLNLGFGYFRNLTFDSSNDLQFKSWTATVEIQKHAGSGLYNGTGYIDGIYVQSAGETFLKYITSTTGIYIKEFSFENSSDLVASGRYSYNKNCSFSIDSGIYEHYGVSATDYAKSLMLAVKASYGQEFVLSPEYPTFYQNGSGLSYTTQSFDVINNIYSFSERFDFQSGLPYIWDYTHSLNFGDGISEISENGKITSALISGSKFAPAETAWAEIKTGIFDRISGIYNNYKSLTYQTGLCSLYNYPISTSVTKDYCGGTIDYSQSYSSSPFVRSGYFYSYENQISYDTDGYIQVSENGNLKAYKNVRPSGFNLVKAAYTGLQPTITSRISGIYNNYTGYNTRPVGMEYVVIPSAGWTGLVAACPNTGVFTRISSDETYKEFDAEISYGFNYSSSPKYISDATGIMYDTSYSVSQPLHIANYFPVAYDSVIAQKAQQSTRGIFSNKISITAQTGVTVNDLVAAALTRIRKPSGTDVYASDYNYSFDKFSRQFSLSLGYSFSLHRDGDDFLVW